MKVTRPALTVREIMQLRRDCFEISRPYIHLVADIYARSTFKLIIRKDGVFSETIYPPATEKLVSEVRAEMVAAIEAYQESRATGIWQGIL